MYNNIIEAEKSQKESHTDLDVARINCRFMHAFCCGLSSDIQTLVGNDFSPIEMYEMVEKPNQKLEMGHNS